nr:hypothetical protein [uncultured Rhodoferax sp.]
MTIMRANHVINEIKKLGSVIENLIFTYNSIFKEYDSDEISHFQIGPFTSEADEYYNNREVCKTFSQFQVELMLVKHVALIENMIVEIFRHLTCNLLNNEGYQKEYFAEGMNFSDSMVAANKISLLTDKKIRIKKMEFWCLLELMRTIRHHIAHGEPGFIIRYEKAIKFNEQINILELISEINECAYTKTMYPTLLHPTHENKSNWLCCVSENIKELPKLNLLFLKFAEEVRKSYISYGEEKGISQHAIYGRIPKF